MNTSDNPLPFLLTIIGIALIVGFIALLLRIIKVLPKIEEDIRSNPNSGKEFRKMIKDEGGDALKQAIKHIFLFK